VILTNPFITGNPDAAAGLKVEEITRADLILIPNGHRDHNSLLRPAPGFFLSVRRNDPKK